MARKKAGEEDGDLNLLLGNLLLGNSLLSFMRQLGMSSNSGGDRSDRNRLRNQIDRLFNAHVQLIYETPGNKVTASSAVADRTELWWDYRTPEQDTLWQSRIHLGEAFFNEIIAHPIPLDMRILKEMRKDVLAWPALSFGTPVGCLEIRPCPPSVPPKSITAG
jgi:hypothetical protein